MKNNGYLELNGTKTKGLLEKEAFEGTMPTIYQIKAEICEIGKRMYNRGFVASNDGNITVKIGDDEYLATPTGVSKGYMNPEDIIVVDSKGEKKFGSLRPSSEIKMHMLIYRRREDVKAVVHAHPVTATAFAVAGIPLTQCVLPEIIVTMGAVPLASYATPSTEEVPNSLLPYIDKADAIMLANHGVVTVGKDLLEAYHRMESVEHFAKVLFHALQLGNVNYLSKENVDALIKVREKMGLGGKKYECEVCSVTDCPLRK